MKKETKILIGLLCFPIVVVIAIFLICAGYYEIKEDRYIKEGKQALFEYVQSTEIPEEQVIVLNEGIGAKFFTLFSYNRDITTKKDYENWKIKIKKTGKYLNGDLVAKNYQPKYKDCELQYSLGYDLDSKKINLQYVLSGNSIFDKKSIKENFAYPNIPFEEFSGGEKDSPVDTDS